MKENPRQRQRALRMFRMRITTFWKSCSDARHYYGVVRDQGNVKFYVARADSVSEVERNARRAINRRFPGQRFRLSIDKRVIHY